MSNVDVVCCTIHCPRYSSCARASINNPGTHPAASFGTLGEGYMDMNARVYHSWCGMEGNYNMYIPLYSKPMKRYHIHYSFSEYDNKCLQCEHCHNNDYGNAAWCDKVECDYRDKELYEE